MKNMHATLGLYLARQYIQSIAGFLIVILCIMGLFDAIEHLRRLGKIENMDSSLVGYLTLLKIPGNILIIAPFIILFAAMMTLSGLTKRQEFVVMRTAGASLWQLMRPFFIVAFCYGTVLVGIIHPLAAATERRYEQYEEKFLKKEQHMIALLGQGLWLRQKTDQGDNYLILYAKKVTLPQWDLDNVMVMFFDPEHHLLKRIDAAHANLADGEWIFPTAFETGTGPVQTQIENYRLPTVLTRGDLDESFSTPETVSFWAMPAFINMLAATGFPVTRLQIYFGSLIMLPFLCAALIMIATAVSIHQNRGGHGSRMLMVGVIAGFIVFFMSNFLQALGASGQIPIWLAVVSPAGLALASGVIAILSIEDQ